MSYKLFEYFAAILAVKYAHARFSCPKFLAMVWKKNGIVLQNSTSITYQLTITEENNDKYSCEVNRQDGFDKKEIIPVMERELFLL